MCSADALLAESSRLSRGVAVTLAAVLIAGCSPSPEPLALFPGRSTRPAGGATIAPPSSAKAPEVWERWPEVAGFRVAIERSPSQHLAADHEGETLASSGADAYPRAGPTRRFEPGAALVQRLYAPGATEPEVLFAMVQRPQDRAAPDAAGTTLEETSARDWEYLVVTPAGLVLERGALDACVRCHAEAPHHGVFGRAR